MANKINSCLNYHPAKKGKQFTAAVTKIDNKHKHWAWRAKCLAAGVGSFFLVIVISYLAQGASSYLDKLFAPAAILFSASMALYLALVQLNHKERRDRVEHAVDVCEKAPDLVAVDSAMNALHQHIEDAFSRHQLEDDSQSCCNINHVGQQGDWERSILMLQCLADQNPQLLATLIDDFDYKYPRFIANIAKVMAFFEKSAIGIQLGHADDEVIWMRFNVAALKCWIKGYGFILKSWGRHRQSKHLLDAMELGFPYEHYEAWLRHHCDDKELTEMLGRLHNIRMKMLKALDQSV